MTIPNVKDHEFNSRLYEYVKPAKAVVDPKHLFGRRKNLQAAGRALEAPGRQIFIFGERGVGKTSLAKTAARQGIPEQFSKLVACEKNSTFPDVINDVVLSILPICRAPSVTRELHTGLSILGLSVGGKISWAPENVKRITNINEAIAGLKSLEQTAIRPPYIIIDEFDRLESAEDKGRFADFLKQMSDQELRMKFIFCGISKDVDSLIGDHFSAGRYIEPIELGVLSPGDLFQIIQTACDAFQVEIDREYLIRVSLISDGYPYFVHLITEHLLILMHEKDEVCVKVTADLFQTAVQQAIEKAEPMLKGAYDKATKKYLDDYQQVLWSVAAMKLFENKWLDIYERAYVPLFGLKKDALDQETFYQRILKLTQSNHGGILTTNQNGWYKFSEGVVRSYVRLRADENGVDLGVDLHPGALSRLPK